MILSLPTYSPSILPTFHPIYPLIYPFIPLIPPYSLPIYPLLPSPYPYPQLLHPTSHSNSNLSYYSSTPPSSTLSVLFSLINLILDSQNCLD